VLEGMAYLLEAQGERTNALKKLDRAAEVMAVDPEPWGYIGVYSPMARMKMAGGDHAGALQAASSCMEVAALTGDEAGWCTCSILAGEAQLALGNSEEQKDSCAVHWTPLATMGIWALRAKPAMKAPWSMRPRCCATSICARTG